MPSSRAGPLKAADCPNKTLSFVTPIVPAVLVRADIVAVGSGVSVGRDGSVGCWSVPQANTARATTSADAQNRSLDRRRSFVPRRCPVSRCIWASQLLEIFAKGYSHHIRKIKENAFIRRISSRIPTGFQRRNSESLLFGDHLELISAVGPLIPQVIHQGADQVDSQSADGAFINHGLHIGFRCVLQWIKRQSVI